MEKHIRESMNDSILEEACKLYSIEFKDIKYHGGFESFIYIFKRKSVEYILRLTHSDHKASDQVLGEIEFIDYLANHNACVSTVIKSVNNTITEKIMVNKSDYFTVSSFIKGIGKMVEIEARTPKFWQDFGEQVGLLHRLTKNFIPKNIRSSWENDSLYLLAPKFLSEKHSIILEKLDNRVKKISGFSRTIDNFGLIHTDLHFGNMVIDETGKLTFFDFDDSAYKHFISDIAIILFYQFAFVEMSTEEITKKSLWILKEFLKGYEINNYLPRSEFENLHDFFKLRELTLYTVIVASGEEDREGIWGKGFIDKYKQRIIDDTPFMDVEYILKELDI